MAVERFDRVTTPRDADAVVIGIGALGLMLTKHLTDLGQNVVAIDSSPQIAYGPSTKNHGWLHNGVIHAVPGKELEEDFDQRDQTVKSLQYGRQFFASYAPEALDQPFKPTYAMTESEERANVARAAWEAHKVPYREVDKERFLKSIEPSFNPDAANFFFENDDARINNRLLFQKLITEARRNGATVLRAATYDYINENTISVSNATGDEMTVSAPLFFYTTGPNLDDSYQKLMGESLNMEYYKSHLLLLPRVTYESLVTLDADKPIIINHGDVSIVNRARDDVRIEDKDDIGVDPFEVKSAIDVLSRTIDSVEKYREDIHAIACIKPSIPKNGTSTGKHSVSGTQVEPIPGHIFAGAGKMTLAPALAAEMIRNHSDKLNLEMVTPRPTDDFLRSQASDDDPDLQITA